MEVIKIKPAHFEWTLTVFTIFDCLLMKKIRSKVFACFYEIVYLLIMKIHSNRFQGSCSGFPIVTLKVVPKAACDPKIVRKAAMNVQCQKSTICSEGKLEQKLTVQKAAFKTIFRNSKCFQRIKQKLYINFSLEL